MNAIEQRLQRLEDIEAIRQLKARYFHACDAKDVATIRDCFGSGEIHIDYGAIGQFRAREDFVIDMHHGQNAQIHRESAEQASAVWDLYFFQVNMQTGMLTQLAGYYEDRYGKQNGQWVILETVFRVTSSLISQNDAGILKVIHAGAAPAG